MSKKSTSHPPFKDYPLTQVSEDASQALFSDDEANDGNASKTEEDTSSDDEDDGSPPLLLQNETALVDTPSPIFKGKARSRKHLIFSDGGDEEDDDHLNHANKEEKAGKKSETTKEAAIGQQATAKQEGSKRTQRSAKTYGPSINKSTELHAASPAYSTRLVTTTPARTEVMQQEKPTSMKIIRQAEKKRRIEQKKQSNMDSSTKPPLAVMQQKSDEQQQESSSEVSTTTGILLDSMPTLLNLAKRSQGKCKDFAPFKIPVSDNQYIALSEISVSSRGRIDPYKYVAVSLCRRLANGSVFQYSFALSMLPVMLEALHAIEKATAEQQD